MLANRVDALVPRVRLFVFVVEVDKLSVSDNRRGGVGNLLPEGAGFRCGGQSADSFVNVDVDVRLVNDFPAGVVLVLPSLTSDMVRLTLR
jgi:hypothetical protein